jgi:hypothetical protein
MTTNDPAAILRVVEDRQIVMGVAKLARRVKYSWEGCLREKRWGAWMM